MRTLQLTKGLEKLKEFFLVHPLLFILGLTLLVRIIYLWVNYPLWWDSYVYIGMGKYLFSHGQLGMWEVFRPLIHPSILGLFWKLGLNISIVGKFLDLLFSTLGVYLVYKIAEKVYSKNTAILSSLLFSLTPVFIMFTGLILTEPLALLFGLLGFYFFLQKESQSKNYLAGLFLALSFLTKFPQGIWFGAALITVLLNSQKIKDKLRRLILISGGFLTLVIPYLILNYFLYQNPFLPLTSGSEIIKTAVWQYGSGWGYYFVNFFLKNWLYLLFFPAIYLFFKDREWREENKILLLSTSLLVMAYFLYLPRKEVRYLVMGVPVMALIIGNLLNKFYLNIKSSDKKILKVRAFWTIFTFLLLLPLPFSLSFERYPTFETQISQIQEEHHLNGIILTSDPAFVSYLDQPIVTLNGIEFAPSIYEKQRGNYQLLFLNECDLSCDPEDSECQTQKKQLLQQVHFENEIEYSLNFKNCNYFILLPK